MLQKEESVYCGERVDGSEKSFTNNVETELVALLPSDGFEPQMFELLV